MDPAIRSTVQVKCDSGYILDQSKLDTGGTKDECCVKTCSLFTCTLGSAFCDAAPMGTTASLDAFIDLMGTTRGLMIN